MITLLRISNEPLVPTLADAGGAVILAADVDLIEFCVAEREDDEPTETDARWENSTISDRVETLGRAQLEVGPGSVHDWMDVETPHVFMLYARITAGDITPVIEVGPFRVK